MSMDTSQNSLTMGISFSMSAPFAWRLVDLGLTSQQCEENERLLRIILAMDEYPAEHNEELAALDFKVNIVLELLGEILSHQLNLPDAVNLTLAATELMWTSEAEIDYLLEVLPDIIKKLRAISPFK